MTTARASPGNTVVGWEIILELLNGALHMNRVFRDDLWAETTLACS